MKSHKLGDSLNQITWAVQIHEKAKKELLDLSDLEYERVDEHLEMLRDDPLRPRPTMDIKKVKDTDEGSIYRLRVGENRVIYAAIKAEQCVLILLIEDRELGYKRLLKIAEARLHA